MGHIGGHWELDYETGEWGDPLVLEYLPEEFFDIEEVIEIANEGENYREEEREEIAEVAPEQYMFNFDLHGQNGEEVPNYHPVPRSENEEHMFSPERSGEDELYEALVEAGAEEIPPEAQEPDSETENEGAEEAVHEDPRANEVARGQ